MGEIATDVSPTSASIIGEIGELQRDMFDITTGTSCAGYLVAPLCWQMGAIAHGR